MTENMLGVENGRDEWTVVDIVKPAKETLERQRKEDEARSYASEMRHYDPRTNTETVSYLDHGECVGTEVWT